MLELVFNLLNFLIPLIIAPVAILSYLRVEKDNKVLLLGIAFVFLLLAAIEGGIFAIFALIFPMTESTLGVGNGDKNLWVPLFTFLGYVLLLIIAEPWKVINKLRAKSA